MIWSGNKIYYDEKLRGISPGINYDALVVNGESASGIAGTVLNAPILPGSFVITNGTQTFTDNGLGILVSSISGYSGEVNYSSGAWTVTDWSVSTAESIDYIGLTSPSFVNLNWDAIAYPTIDGIGNFFPVKDQSVAHEVGTLRDLSTWTSIEEYSDYVDLLQLVPAKFRSSVALQQLLYVFGIQVGTWIGEIDDLQTILDKWNVGRDFIQYLASLVGLKLIITPTTTYAQTQQQLLQVIDWYKMKGTYQALQVIGYTLGLNITLYDLYTQDYINFIPEPWYVGQVGTNPPGLSLAYYKSPHLGIEIALNQIYGIAPNTYLFDGASTFSNLVTYVEQVRPINVVPQYSLSLNPITSRDGLVQGDQYTVIPNNLLIDGDFNNWSNSSTLTNWILSGGTLTQTSSNPTSYIGSYCAAVNGYQISIYQMYSSYTALIGQTISFGAWVWSAVAGNGRVDIQDGTNPVHSSSAVHPGDSQWHFLSTTYTISNAATLVEFRCISDGDLSGATAYFSGAVAIEGSSIPSTVVTIPNQSACPTDIAMNIGTGYSFIVGQNISIVYDTDNQMQGTIVSYNSATGQLVMDVVYVIGSGTYDTWNIIGNIRTIALGGWINSQVNYDKTYSTGTVSIDNGSNSLVGSGTTWTQSIETGDQIGFGTTNPALVTTWYDVDSVNSDTSITLAEGSVTNESISGTSGTLINFPVVAGSVILTNGEETYVDNGSGELLSTVSSGLSGTIDYPSGDWSVPSWYGVGTQTASYQVTTYVGDSLFGSNYISAPYYSEPPYLTYDLNQTSFYESITIWRLGTGNIGVIPTQSFTMGNPVLTNYGDAINAPISVNIQGSYVQFSFQLPSTITQNGLTELGLYLSDGATLKVGCTFPAIDLIAGEALQVVVQVNY